MDELDNLMEDDKTRRGKTLPVLCILSWVMIGLTVLGVSFSLIRGPYSEEEMLEQQLAVYEVVNDDMPEFYNEMMLSSLTILERTNEKFYLMNSLNVVSVVVGFFSVLLMYRLKRVGYWLYLLYSAIPICISIYFFGDIKSTMTMLVYSSIFSLTFIILYGVQLKRMS
jgi:hypothetical protein